MNAFMLVLSSPSLFDVLVTLVSGMVLPIIELTLLALIKVIKTVSYRHHPRWFNVLLH